MAYEQYRNQKDWLSFRKTDGSVYINVISYAKKYKWEIEIKTDRSYPVFTKQNITKTQALSLAKKYMLKNK